MSCAKDILEIIYYIAFIGLTSLIVIYAIKTYKFQISKSSKLLCKISASPNSTQTYIFNFDLEIYNYGNDLAKNVKVFIDDKQITTINFIKPNESLLYPIGEVHQMINANRVWLNFCEKELKEEDVLFVKLETDGNIKPFEVNIDILFASRTAETTTLDDVVQSIDNLAKKINSQHSLITRK